MSVLDRLEKKPWVRTASILVRKLSSERKVDIAAQFFHKLLDKDRDVDRITLIAFLTACYDNNKYSVASDLTDKISKRNDKLSTRCNEG